MNLAKKLRQISNNASVGWEERFEKYMTDKCEEAAKVGDTFIIVLKRKGLKVKRLVLRI